jgi:oligosaccharyl transferase (archaeosortase A-associated)
MNKRRFNQKIIAGVLVALFFGVALYIRVALPYAQVFVGDLVKFTGVDTYFFMRLVDNLVHNFPHLITFDPYYLYPGGSFVGIRSFYVYLLAGITWLIGLGSPTQHTIDVVGVYFPAVLGALTTIPVYFIGKALFNRWAGVIAAGLIAILPGEFLGRSILGFTDYHVAEVLFTTITMLFLILAVKSAKQRGLTFQLVKARDWRAVVKVSIYSLLAGIFLGIYILTWSGALLFVFIIFTYLVIQFVIDHLRNKSVDYLCFISTITFLFAILISLPASPGRIFLASLVIAIVIPIVMAVLSYFMARRNMKPIIYPAAIVGLGLISLMIFRIATPSLFQAMIGKLYIFTWPTKTTVMEMRPLLFPLGSFSWSVAWGNFTTSFFLCFIALGILIYSIVKRGESDKTLFVIWNLVILAATLSMRRFNYYFAVNVALLVGYLSWLLLEFSGFRRLTTVPAEAPKGIESKVRDKKKRRDERHPAANWANMVLGVIVVFALVFYPNIGPLPGGKKPVIDVASNPQFSPSDAWCESLSWMRDNTPDPFDNPDFYYELYQPPPRGEGYDYPQTAYGVTAWWDYGYWITRIGRRIPTSNPGTGHKGESRFFMAQDEETANKILDRRGSKYVIVDYAIANAWSGKFHAVATLSGSESKDFLDVYYQPQQGVLKPVRLFYPEYYRSLVCRLYNFDGKQVVPRNSMVISYEQKVNREGQSYKQITGVKSFSDYGEAEAYVAAQKSDNYRIVGSDPFVSPVPLEPLEHYKLVYSSNGTVLQPNGKLVSEVKIFEYSK